jgi:hypothetical protein
VSQPCPEYPPTLRPLFGSLHGCPMYMPPPSKNYHAVDYTVDSVDGLGWSVTVGRLVSNDTDRALPPSLLAEGLGARAMPHVARKPASLQNRVGSGESGLGGIRTHDHQLRRLTSYPDWTTSPPNRSMLRINKYTTGTATHLKTRDEGRPASIQVTLAPLSICLSTVRRARSSPISAARSIP